MLYQEISEAIFTIFFYHLLQLIEEQVDEHPCDRYIDPQRKKPFNYALMPRILPTEGKIERRDRCGHNQRRKWYVGEENSIIQVAHCPLPLESSDLLCAKVVEEIATKKHRGKGEGGKHENLVICYFFSGDGDAPQDKKNTAG